MGIEKRSLTPLKDIVADLFGDDGLPVNTDDLEIWNIWGDVVGPGISMNAKPLWIKKGLLRVTVSDPIWLQELKFSEKTIKEDLNRKLGRKAVRKLDLRVGPMHNY